MEKLNFFKKTLLLLGIIVAANLTGFSQFSGGSGTAEDPWQISSADDLDSIRNQGSGKFYTLTADIDMVGRDFTPLTTGGTLAFNGTIKGKGHLIKNLTVGHGGRVNRIGFIGKLQGVVDSLGFENLVVNGFVDNGDGTVDSLPYVGGIAGEVQNRADWGISNCYVKGGSVYGKDYVGGIVGAFYDLNNPLENCFVDATVEASGFLNNGNPVGRSGGIAGQTKGVITNCAFYGTIEMIRKPANAFAIAKLLQTAASISNCYFDENCLGVKNASADASTALTATQLLDQASYIGLDFSTAPYWKMLTGGYAVLNTQRNFNESPVAEAGSAQATVEALLVTLDGSASTTESGETLTYEWLSTSEITLSDASIVNPTFTAPSYSKDTVYSLVLRVNDGISNSVNDTVLITVTMNTPPVAAAGNDQEVREGDVVTLGGNGTDIDGHALTYAWTAPASISLSASDVAAPTFTAPELDTDEVFIFSLVVNDGLADSPVDEMQVTVKANIAPVANAGNDKSVAEGSLVALNGTASADADNDDLIFEWTAPAGITLSATNIADPTFTTPEVDVDTDYDFTLKVSDIYGDFTTDEVRVTVLAAFVNTAPVAVAGDDQEVREASVVLLDGSNSNDANDDHLTFTWTAPAGITLSATDKDSVTFTAPLVDVDTDYAFALVVNDGTDNSEADEIVITVKANVAPIADAGVDQNVQQGDVVTLDGSASTDAEDDELTYEWTASDGIVLSDVNAVKPTFIAPNVSVETNYTFSLTVNDGLDVSIADEVVVTVYAPGNVPPTPNAGDDQIVDAGALVTLGGGASYDSNGDSLSFTWTSLSTEIVLSDASQVSPTFTAPSVEVETDYTFTLMVNDGEIDSKKDTVVVTVVPVSNTAPIADAGADQIVNKGELVTLSGMASSDPEDDALLFSWKSLSTEIKLSDVTAVSPTFTAPDITGNTNYEFVLTVSDGEIKSEGDTVVVTVLANTKPVAVAGDDQVVNEGAEVILSGLNSIDVDGDDLSYKWTAPEGITLSNATSATPTFIAPEVDVDTDFEIQLVVSDGVSESEVDAIVVTVQNKVAVNFAESLKISVYPNPVSDWVNVEMHTSANITVSNILGEVILIKQGKQGVNRISLSDYPKGIYLITVNTDNEVDTKRIVVD